MTLPNNSENNLSVVDLVDFITSKAKKAQTVLSQSSHSSRRLALSKIAEKIRKSSREIIECNQLDLSNANNKKQPNARIKPVD